MTTDFPKGPLGFEVIQIYYLFGQEPCSSIGTSWCSEQRCLGFNPPSPNYRIIKNRSIISVPFSMSNCSSTFSSLILSHYRIEESLLLNAYLHFPLEVCWFYTQDSQMIISKSLILHYMFTLGEWGGYTRKYHKDLVKNSV